MEKEPIRRLNVRLSPHARRLLNSMAYEMGISRTAVLERAIRQLAKEETITEREGRKENDNADPFTAGHATGVGG